MQPHPVETRRAVQDQQQYRSIQRQPASTSHALCEVENSTLDLFQPFFDPAMLDLFPNGDIPDLSRFDMGPSSLDCFDVDGWQNNQNIPMNS